MVARHRQIFENRDKFDQISLFLGPLVNFNNTRKI